MTLTKERRKELEARGGQILSRVLLLSDGDTLTWRRKLTEPEEKELRGIEHELDEFDGRGL